MSDVGDVTEMLQAWRGGDRRALERLMPRLYDTLREMASVRLRREGTQQTLEPTALVHEALVRLLGADTDWQNRAHFLALAAMHMRSVLVDQARARLSAKRGGDVVLVTLSHAESAEGQRIELDLLALDQALSQLHNEDERIARVVEMSYFAGMEREEIAAVVGISVPTVDRDLRFARAWLNRVLS
ncbi:RNA polymerase ECF family sigma subunit [Tahibacter aquaticus]|uniref:RNA polymerase ECF family sigma subunit n=1 Tax=Tahibacter aquaticus TaxID=520092 RepID=A0A4R6ZA49_9GAMM|nr:ECF-type sigma factor [Tahibacter aquaticus]TDR48803.1 RNA polymerase ECF family sigma subunit [Tahibacter aquaticus]